MFELPLRRLHRPRRSRAKHNSLAIYATEEGLRILDDQGNTYPIGGGQAGPPGQNGSNGSDGAPGASAYEIAIANGFSGTEVEWLASLKGDTGEPGDDGQPGQDGSDGQPGQDGQDGAEGPPGPGIEAGIIVMWSGTLSAIPSGWALCNGQNGTPDLRDRFVVGAANGANPGATGGLASHQHAAHSGVLAHGHGVTDPGHFHAMQRFPTATGGSTGFTVDTSMSGTQATANDTAAKVTGLTVNNAGSGSEYTHDSLDNRPPHYALAFIMKLAA